jgi:hypothetical protein
VPCLSASPSPLLKDAVHEAVGTRGFTLVLLQRAVAAAHKVQLVYTTGVKDPDAVSRFPNVIRLDNRSGRTRNRHYIVPDDTPAGQPDPRLVTGVRVAHDESTGNGEDGAEAEASE